MEAALLGSSSSLMDHACAPPVSQRAAQYPTTRLTKSCAIPRVKPKHMQQAGKIWKARRAGRHSLQSALLLLT